MPIELLGKEVRFLVPTGRNTDKRGHEFEVWQWLDDAMNREFSAGWQQSAMLRVADRVSGGIKGRWFDKENDEAVVDNCSGPHFLDHGHS